MIAVNGRRCWTLFDSGARNTYVTPSVAELVKTAALAPRVRASLGGSVKESDRAALLEGEIQGHRFFTNALVIDEIGADEDGKQIEVLFGALAMQQWGIRLAVAEDKLDLSRYPSEFVEY